MASALIDVAELRARLGDPGWRVVDCRHDLRDAEAGRRAWQAERVPGAVHAHLDRDLSGAITPQSGRHPLPDPAVFGRWCREGARISRGSTVVAYDAAGGAFAARLWWLLRDFGHGEVRVLDGGFPAWLAAGAPVERGRPAPGLTEPPGDFVGTPGHRPAATAGEVAGGSFVLLDARDPERYRGEIEPIDVRAGHIPGARNAPYKQSLAPDGRFLPPEALRAQLAPLLGGRRPDQVVAYCGSGVTACHLLLAAEAAGLGVLRLYPGSWSEWIRDPARPVA